MWITNYVNQAKSIEILSDMPVQKRALLRRKEKRTQNGYVAIFPPLLIRLESDLKRLP